MGIIRRQDVKIPGENALADDRTVRMIEVAGRRRNYRIADVKRELALAAGELAVVCATRDADHDPAYRRMREKIEGASVEDRLPAASVDVRAIVVGKGVWAVLRDARFDRVRKKLILTAVDLEASYFVAAGAPVRW